MGKGKTQERQSDWIAMMLRLLALLYEKNVSRQQDFFLNGTCFLILNAFAVDNRMIMIEIVVFIQYRSQLERTRQSVVQALDTGIKKAMEALSARQLRDGALPVYEADNTRTGFALELSCALGLILESYEKVSPELFGMRILVQEKASRESAIALKMHMRSLLFREQKALIWCDSTLGDLLAPWADVGEPEADEYPLLVLNLPQTKRQMPPFWQLAGVQSSLAELFPKSFKDPPAFYFIQAPEGLGIHWILDEEVSSRYKDVSPFIVHAETTFHPLYNLFLAIMVEIDHWSQRDEVLAGMSRALFPEMERRRLCKDVPQRIEKKILEVFSACMGLYVKRCRMAGIPALCLLGGVEQFDGPLCSALLAILEPLTSQGGLSLIASGEGSCPQGPWRDAGARLFSVDWPSKELLTKTVKAVLGRDLPPPLAAHKLPLVDLFRRMKGLNVICTGKGFDFSRLGLSRDLQELFLALYLLQGFLPARRAVAALEKEGKPRAFLERALYHFADEALIVSADWPSCTTGQKGDVTAVLNAEDMEWSHAVCTLVERRIIDEHRDGTLRSTASLLDLLFSLSASVSDELCLEALEFEFSRQTSSQFSSDTPTLILPQRLSKERSALLSYIYTGRSLLLGQVYSGRVEESNRFFSKVPPAFHDEEVYISLCELNRASWHYLNGACVDAASRAKQALILMQRSSCTLGLPRLYCQLALIEIARERIREGMDYLSFAVESAERTVLPEELVRSLALAGVGEFLWGNLARAERLVRRSREIASSSWYDEWEDFASFFLGRILFETGRYRDAIDLFDIVIKNNQDDTDSSRSKLCRAWRYRALVHSGSLKEELPEALALEGDLGLFAVEAACLRRDYRAALDLAESLCELEKPVSYTGFDRPVWDSGFSWIDNRFLVSGGVRLELLQVFANLARANLGESAVAVENIRKMIKDTRLSELDTSDAFSYWVYSHCLYLSGAESLDHGTVLSLAFKRFQRRSSRIDDLDIKRSFMGLHRWNAIMMQDAKKANLI